MRKLAREAVIFMLVSMLLGFVGTFVYQIHDQRRDINNQRDALDKNCAGFDIADASPAHPAVMMSQSYPDGVFVTRAECTLVFGTKKYPVVNFDPGVKLNEQDTRDYDNALERGKTIMNLKIDYPPALFVSAIIGAWSFAVGLGLWLFYRLVRFAVKG
jgi:hypothetical protein